MGNELNWGLGSARANVWPASQDIGGGGASEHVTRYQLSFGQPDTANQQHAQKRYKTNVLTVIGYHSQTLIKTLCFWTSRKLSPPPNAGPLGPPRSGTVNMRFSGATSFG